MDKDLRNPYFAFFNEIGIISQLSRAMFEARLDDGVTVPHFSVLNHLVRVSDGRTPLDLARAFQVPKTSMTNTLAGLEARGFIEIRPNDRDGRSKLVYLTAKGAAFREEAIDRLGDEFRTLAERFPPERIAALLPDLSAIRTILDAMRDRTD